MFLENKFGEHFEICLLWLLHLDYFHKSWGEKMNLWNWNLDYTSQNLISQRRTGILTKNSEQKCFCHHFLFETCHNISYIIKQVIRRLWKSYVFLDIWMIKSSWTEKPPGWKKSSLLIAEILTRYSKISLWQMTIINQESSLYIFYGKALHITIRNLFSQRAGARETWVAEQILIV